MHDFFQRQVHPVVAIDQVTVERLAVLEFDEHRVALCRRQEAEWELFSVSIQSCLSRSFDGIRNSDAGSTYHLEGSREGRMHKAGSMEMC